MGNDFMKINQIKLYQGLAAAILLSSWAAVRPAVAAEVQVQLSKTAPIEADPAAPMTSGRLEAIDIQVQPAESRKILAAPGFAQLKTDFESFIRFPAAPIGKTAAPTAPTQTLNFPIPPENFIYNQGGVGLASGAVNQQYFRHCFAQNYGILGGASDRVLPPPVRATADSGVSPDLTDANLKRLQSLTANFRYAFNGGFGSSLSLYVVNLNTQKTQFVGTLPTTNGNRDSACAKVSQDLTPYIREPGAYGLRLVMVNRGFGFPHPLPPIGPTKAGKAPGDVIDLPIGDLAIGSDKVRWPIHPIHPSRKAVAGFDQLVVTVKRRQP
jgi:hypothetical protein